MYITCPICRQDVARIRTEAREDLPPRIVYDHADGSTCRPLTENALYKLRCRDCGRDIRCRVIASPSIRRSAGELRCDCGARWRLEGVSLTVGVYVTNEAA